MYFLILWGPFIGEIFLLQCLIITFLRRVFVTKILISEDPSYKPMHKLKKNAGIIIFAKR